MANPLINRISRLFHGDLAANRRPRRSRCSVGESLLFTLSRRGACLDSTIHGVRPESCLFQHASTAGINPWTFNKLGF